MSDMYTAMEKIIALVVTNALDHPDNQISVKQVVGAFTGIADEEIMKVSNVCACMDCVLVWLLRAAGPDALSIAFPLHRC